MTSIRKAPELAGCAASSFAAALFALLVPKCPLCVAAYLLGFGLSSAAAHSAAPFVRPLAFTLLGGALLALGFWVSRLGRSSARCCRQLSTKSGVERRAPWS